MFAESARCEASFFNLCGIRIYKAVLMEGSESMELVRTPRRRYRNSRIRLWLIAVVCALLITSGYASYLYWEKYHPNGNHINPGFDALKKPIFYQGLMMDLPALGEQEGLMLPLPVIQKWIDPTIVYEEKTESIIITTEDKVVYMKTDQLTALMNDKPFSLRFPVHKEGENIYLPIEPLRVYYNMELRESEETSAVILVKEGDVLQWGKVLPDPERPEETIPMRQNASIKAPILVDLQAGDEMMIWNENNGYYEVQLENGYMGFVDKADITLDHLEQVPVAKEQQAYVPWKPIGGKINLTWEQVFNKNPDTGDIGDMPGLNVISPTWFHLTDGEGNMDNKADAAYVRWAQSRGYQVWALFSNGFNPDWTTEALAAYEKRTKIIKQLLGYAQMYHLQGINIDFENVYIQDKANLTQFVKELTPLAHEQGLVVSIDVTIRGGSEMWSLFYDRHELGKIVDYMMVMTYDEHWATSPKAGSVASLPWVEKGIVDIMREDNVPASKLVLGVPYYTRIWTEQVTDGKTSVSSKAVFMEVIQRIIKEMKLTPVYSEQTGQHYVEYKEGKDLKKIWIEDETSMKARIELVKKYDLAGVASWRRGYELPAIWDVVKSALEKRP